MRVLRKYAFVALLSARSNVVYLAEVMSRVVFLGVMLYIFFQLWHAVFSQSGLTRLGGLTLQQMLWYLTVTEAIMLSAPRVSAAVDLDVRSGSLVNYLKRPVSYPLYSLASNLGERGVRFLVNLLVGAAVTILLVGLPQLSWQGLLFFTAAIPFAFIVDFLACFLVGLGAFWLEDTSGVFLIYSRVSMIFGGLLVPLSLFPDGVRRVLEYMPFAAVIYGPAELLVSPSPALFASLLFRQLLGITVLSLFVFAVYKQAGRRIFVNGG